MNEPIIHEGTGKAIAVCTGCGHLNIDSIGPTFLSCCPDSNYIPLRQYIKFELTEIIRIKKLIMLYESK